jgi:glycosyltransferase involved in cell wall biosynthesis
MKWARKKNIPLVFTWHTLYDQYAHFAPLVPEKLAALWTIKNARNYANRSDAVITPTPFVKEIIRGWGVKNENIAAIPTGVEESMFADPDRDAIRKKYGIREDEIVLLTVGRFTAEKNVEFVFEAVADILKNNPKTKFLACGEGYLQKKLEKIIEDSGVKNQVIFAGFVDNKIKKDYYAAGDIFIYASKSETQGMILTEAMYSGLPIVAVKAPGARDIILDGRTGFLVEEDKNKFVQAVQKLIDNQELRGKFSAKARQVAREKYTSSVCAKRMLEVYKKAINVKNFMSFPRKRESSEIN